MTVFLNFRDKSNVSNWQNYKKKLMQFVDIESKTKAKDIHKLKYLLNTKTTVEPLIIRNRPKNQKASTT